MEIGGTDIIFEWLAVTPTVAFTEFVAAFSRLWPNAVYAVFRGEQMDEYSNAGDIDYKDVSEIIISKDQATSDSIDKVGVTDENANLFVHALSNSHADFTVVIHHYPTDEIVEIVNNLKKNLCD